MLASGHFQDAIEPPSAFDIVVLILWSRLGTPLAGADRSARISRHRRPRAGNGNGMGIRGSARGRAGRERPISWCSAISVRRRSTRANPKRGLEACAQLNALDQFWRRHFADHGVFLAAYDEYRTLEEFAHRLEESLRKLIERRIKSLAAEQDRRLRFGWAIRSAGSKRTNSNTRRSSSAEMPR